MLHWPRRAFARSSLLEMTRASEVSARRIDPPLRGDLTRAEGERRVKHADSDSVSFVTSLRPSVHCTQDRMPL